MPVSADGRNKACEIRLCVTSLRAVVKELAQGAGEGAGVCRAVFELLFDETLDRFGGELFEALRSALCLKESRNGFEQLMPIFHRALRELLLLPEVPKIVESEKRRVWLLNILGRTRLDNLHLNQIGEEVLEREARVSLGRVLGPVARAGA